MYVANEDYKGSKNGYEALAQAIIVQAAKDYKKALERDARGFCREIERFFHSDWFTVLSDANPDMILQRLRREVKGNDS